VFRAVQLLADEGIELDDIRLDQSSLDDVFLTLTRRSGAGARPEGFHA
jgi:hypothetical protein